MRRLRAVLLVLAVVAFGLVFQSGGDARRALPRLIAGSGGPAAGPFTLSGSVTGLYPGAVTPLPVQITNSNSYALAITHLDTAVGASDRAGCGGTHLTVTPLSAAVVVPARSSAVVTLTARLAAAVPDACQGAQWALRFTGLGQRTPLPTSLTLDPISLHVAVPTVSLTNLGATLRILDTTIGVAGKTVTWSSGDRALCSAVTNAEGHAQCDKSSKVNLNLLITATFAGDAQYESSRDSAVLLNLRSRR